MHCAQSESYVFLRSWVLVGDYVDWDGNVKGVSARRNPHASAHIPRSPGVNNARSEHCCLTVGDIMGPSRCGVQGMSRGSLFHLKIDCSVQVPYRRLPYHKIVVMITLEFWSITVSSWAYPEVGCSARSQDHQLWQNGRTTMCMMSGFFSPEGIFQQKSIRSRKITAVISTRLFIVVTGLW